MKLNKKYNEDKQGYSKEYKKALRDRNINLGKNLFLGMENIEFTDDQFARIGREIKRIQEEYTEVGWNQHIIHLHGYKTRNK